MRRSASRTVLRPKIREEGAYDFGDQRIVGGRQLAAASLMIVVTAFAALRGAVRDIR